MELDFEPHRERAVKKLSFTVVDIAINCNGVTHPAKLSEVRRLLIERRHKTGEYLAIMQWFREASNKDFYAFIEDCRKDQQAIGQTIEFPRFTDYVV
jgi:hypothetical protein